MDDFILRLLKHLDTLILNSITASSQGTYPASSYSYILA